MAMTASKTWGRLGTRKRIRILQGAVTDTILTGIHWASLRTRVLLPVRGIDHCEERKFHGFSFPVDNACIPFRRIYPLL